MKIAFLGNMNNMMFQIGRYLMDEKHDATFFLFDEFEHFLPEADTFENISKYKIVQLGWNHELYIKTSKNEIKNLLKGFDLYIGTDLSPAFLYKAGMKLDIYFSHGNDLYDYPFRKYHNKPPQLWEIAPYITGKAQFEGIKEVSVFSLDVSDDLYEIPLSKIKTIPFLRIVSPPFLYLPQYEKNFIELSDKFSFFKELRSKYRFIAFQHSSQDWSDRGPFKINKANDILINAFSEYLKESNNKEDSVLVLLEYGYDVPKSKQLIHDLGINKNVIWLPKMQRKDIMVAIHFSDICVGEMGERFWFSYSCVYEFMAMKKPIIAHRNDKFYKSKGVDLYQMIDANDIATVKNTFVDFRIDPEKYKGVGEMAFIWAQKNTTKCVNAYLDIINKKQNGKLPSNKIINNMIKKICFYLKPNIIYSYFFLYYHQVKLKVKQILRYESR